MIILFLIFILGAHATSLNDLSEELCINIMTFLDIRSVINLQLTDKYLHFCVQKSNLRAQKLAKDFNLPALATIPFDRDLDILDGFKFSDCFEDRKNMLVLFVTMLETSHASSLVKVPLMRIIACELAQLSVAELGSFKSTLLDTIYIDFDNLILMYFARFNMHNELCDYLEQRGSIRLPRLLTDFQDSVALGNFANAHPLIFKERIKMKQDFDFLWILSGAELNETVISVLFIQDCDLKHFCSLLKAFLYPEFLDNRAWIDNREERARNIKRVIELLPDLPVHKILLKIGFGEPVSQKELLVIKNSDKLVYCEAFRLALGSLQFDLAFNLLPPKSKIDYIFKHTCTKFLKFSPAFEKYMFHNHPQKYKQIHFGRAYESLYATMLFYKINDPIQVALQKGPENWNYATDDDLELIYNGTKQNMRNLAYHYAFTRLALRRYSTPHGRAWIRSEMAGCELFQRIHSASELKTTGIDRDHIEMYVQMKSVMLIAHQSSVAMFFDGPELTLNECALSKAISVVSSSLTESILHLDYIVRQDLLFSFYKSSPTLCALERQILNYSLSEQIHDLIIEMRQFSLIHVMSLISNDNLDDLQLDDNRITHSPAGLARFLKSLKSNMTREKWQQFEKICQWIRISFN